MDALDLYARFAKSHFGIGGWGHENVPRDGQNPKSATCAEREGVAMDAYIQLQQSMFSHEAGRAGRGSWGKTISSPPNAPRIAEREGVDEYARACQSVISLGQGWAVRATPSPSEHPPACVNANREGIDAYGVATRGLLGKPSFGASAKPDNPRSEPSATREGIDAYAVRTQAFLQDRLADTTWAYARNYPSGRFANRQREGIDMYELAHQGLHRQIGESVSFGYQVQDAGKNTGAPALREGVDVNQYTAIAQSTFGHGGSGWGKSLTNGGAFNATLNNFSANAREGVHTPIPAEIPDMVGFVLPFADGADFLFYRTPAKCETVNDNGRLADFTRAWVDHPQRIAALLESGELGEDATLFDIAETALEEGWEWEVDYIHPIIAHWRIARAVYGAAMSRLKRAQIERRTPLQVIETYQHETSLILAMPPPGTADGEMVEVAEALAAAQGERAMFVPPANPAERILIDAGFYRKGNLFHSWEPAQESDSPNEYQTRFA